MSHTHTSLLNLYKPATDDTLGDSLTGFNGNADILDNAVIGVAGILGLASGGSAKALIASNGGIVYSDADSLEILAGTATALKLLMSQANVAPIWSTPTYPNTAALGKIHIGDGTNVVESTPKYPNASATAGKVIRSDGTDYASSTFTIPDTVASGSILVANSANVLSALTWASAGTKMMVNTSGVLSMETVTGTGAPVLATTPTLVTPVLGVATATSITASSNAGLKLYEDGGSGVFVKDGGNVGIGTEVPAAKLQIDVANVDNVQGLFIDFNETGDYNALIVDSESNSYAAIDVRGKFPLYIINDLSGGSAIQASRNLAEAGNNPLVNLIDDNASNTQTTLRVQQDGAGDIFNLFDGATEVFTVLDGGNVGIGTESPSAKLAINGGFHVGGESDPGDNNVLIDGYTQVNGSVIPYGLAMSPVYATDGTYTWGRTNSPTWTTTANNGLFSSTNNNITAPDGTTTGGTFNLNASSWDAFHLIDPVVAGTVYIFSAWVKLGTATNFCVVINDTSAWDTVNRKCFTSADGLNTTTWTKISLPFIAPASAKVNIHIGGHGETLTQQTAGSVFCWNWEVTTGAGMQINSKVGFYGTTPVAQPSAIANATDAASAITQLNLALATLRSLGLIAT